MSDNITLDLVETCHSCGGPAAADEKCPFDLEMNPDENPKPCCRDCASECAYSV
jgi:hypothetical protein